LDLIQDLNQQLNKLSSWKNWAAENKRENLYHQAQHILLQINEQLSTSSESKVGPESEPKAEPESKDLENIYQTFSGQIKQLRQEWKELKGRSDDKMWEKFNQCCNQSFELFAPYLEQQTQLRQENTKKKETLCQQLENYIQHMHWRSATNQEDKLEADENINSKHLEQIDWKQVDSILKQAKKEWNAIGASDRASYKALFSRYKAATTIIEHKRHKAWEINSKKFETLIVKAKELDELIDSDLTAAIKECKKLQADWKKVGPTQQRQRKILWKNFRSACDKVFSKRNEKCAA